VLIGRKYALKILSERANATDEMVARFHREAVAAASVGSEHVVEVTDMGRLDDGTTFLVMEYLQGVELAHAVFEHGPFAPDRAVRIACQLCDALTAVHQTGIVHRDLKPENLFLIQHTGSADFVKVLDFGVCKLLEPEHVDPDQPPLTRTNASLGTPQYMAPEQFQNSAGVDHRADIHAAGAIVYFMLTGKPPFDAPTMGQLFMRICVDPPPPLLALRPDLPPELDAVLRRALSKQPEERFENAAALKAALLPFSELRTSGAAASITRPGAIGGPTQRSTFEGRPTASRATSARPSWLPQRGRWLRPLAAAALVLGLAATMAWAGASGATEARPDRPLTSPERPERQVVARPRPAPSVTTAGAIQDSASLPSAPQSERPRPKPTKHTAPQASTSPASEAVPASSSPSASEPAAAPVPAAPSGADATEDLYRFPRRALKDVF
jgi:eukaryotic-like serine/threonine-protein kinase